MPGEHPAFPFAVMFDKKINTAALRTSSKIALRLSCLDACGNDIERASALYDFISAGLDLPDAEPVPVGGFDRFRANADQVLQWIGSHREDIAAGYSMIKGAMTRTPADVPPLPKI